MRASRDTIWHGLGCAVAAATIAIAAGCGGEPAAGDDARVSSVMCLVDIAGEVGMNHGHAAVPVPAAHFADVNDRIYDLTPADGHLHTLRVEWWQFEKLLAGEVVVAYTTKELGHPHPVTLRCR